MIHMAYSQRVADHNLKKKQAAAQERKEEQDQNKKRLIQKSEQIVSEKAAKDK